MAAPKKITTLKTGDKHEVESLAFSPNGEILASGGGDKSIKLWRVATGTCIATLEGRHFWDLLEFSSDGKILVAAETHGRDTITLWDLDTRKQIAEWDGHKLSCLALSADSKSLATGSEDKSIQLWDLTTTMKARR